MAKLFNRAKMTTSTTGTGTITLGSASNGFQSFADAGVANGDVVQYVIEEGSNFEIGTGTYTSSGTTLTRSPTESSNSDAAITLAGQATVSITAVAADMNRLQHNGSDKVTVSSTGASVTGNISVTGTVDGRDIATDGSKLDGIATNANNYSLPLSSSSTRGGVKVGYTENGKNYPVELSSEKMFVNVPWTDTTPNNATITISAGTDLTTGGNFTTNQGTNETITINHADTSTLSGTYGSTANGTKIDQITVDARGHVTAITTGATGDIDGVTAGSGLTGGGTSGTVTISHADTSSQGSVNNSGRTYIQDITLDTYGHITGITSATETVVNTNTTYSAGSGISLSGTTFSHSDTSSQSSVNNSGNTFIQDITVDTYGHITGLTSGTATASANNDIFWENGQNVTSNYTITNGKNAMSAGPITVNSGVTVTVGDGETWTVV